MPEHQWTIFALTACVVQAAFGQPAFEGLGEPDGLPPVVARCISADGAIIRGPQFVWTREGGIQTMPYSSVRAMSADGTKVVGDGFLWAAAGGSVALSFDPVGISADGAVVVGNQAVIGGVRWTAQEGVLPTGNCPDGTRFQVTAVSADGTTLAGNNSLDNSLGYRWRADSGFLQLQEDCPFVYPMAVSSDGAVTGGTMHRALSPFGCAYSIGLWRGENFPEILGYGEPTYLSGRNVMFRAMTSDASIVVGVTDLPSRGYLPMMWVDGVSCLVEDAIRAQQGDLTGWRITEVVAITPDGRAMIGAGLHNNRPESWIARATTRFHVPCTADLGSQGGFAGIDGRLDNNDFIAFLSLFFTANALADLGHAGGLTGADGVFDNNDFIAFINAFFSSCS